MRLKNRLQLTVIWTVLVATGGPPAFAESSPAPTVRFIYTKGQGVDRCPSEESIRREIAARLGRDPFDTQATRVVAVFLERRDGQLRARIETREEERTIGERQVASPATDCVELTAAMELAIAIAIDPMSVSAANFPPIAPAPPEPPPPPPVIVAPPEPTPEVVFFAGGGPLVSLGSAPEVAIGAVLQVGLQRQRFSIRLEGRADLPAYKNARGGRISASVITVAGVPCVHFGSAGVCALLEGGVLRGSGHGLANAAQVTAPFFALGGRGFYDIGLTSVLAIEVGADITAPITRTTLAVDGEGIWTTSPLCGNVRASFLVHFR